MTVLDIAVRHRQGEFALDVSFARDAPVLALFGPSGSGKTTLLNIIAGLIRPAEGRVAIGERVLLDTAAGVNVPVHRRRIGYVFQDGRLLPHLNVRGNLLYGQRFAPARDRFTDLDAVGDLLGLGALLDHGPATLSGGEKQRVALGRALLAAPRLLLMDEPLASLDAARKAETLPYIERLRDEFRIPIIYVSHARNEVDRLTGAIVHLADGRVAAPPGEA